MKKLMFLFAVLLISSACTDDNEVRFEVRYSGSAEMLMEYFDETMSEPLFWIGSTQIIKKRIIAGQYYRVSVQSIESSCKVEIVVDGKVVKQITAQPLSVATIEGRF